MHDLKPKFFVPNPTTFFFPDCSRPAPQDCQGASPPALCVGLWAVAQDRLNTYATSSRSGVDIRLALRQKVADVFVHGDAHLVKMSSNMVALAGPTLTRPRQVMKPDEIRPRCLATSSSMGRFGPDTQPWRDVKGSSIPDNVVLSPSGAAHLLQILGNKIKLPVTCAFRSDDLNHFVRETLR